LVNLELHGIDVLDATDGLEDLRPHQPDVRVPREEKLRALRGVDFDVARGSIFALLGSNGAGKTTVVKILSTLLKADAGTASVNGFDVATQPASVRESISLTGQFAAVDEILSGRENLVLVARLRHLKGPGKSSSRGESHPPALTEPCLTVSRYTALLI